mmetsp:Transcript_12248/g.18784  ORF Transcript_12248/g.18784 Transcript_12248/m.18784 type:complete len:101 (-) Transcript_12248:1055-1357(-)
MFYNYYYNKRNDESASSFDALRGNLSQVCYLNHNRKRQFTSSQYIRMMKSENIFQTVFQINLFQLLLKSKHVVALLVKFPKYSLVLISSEVGHLASSVLK